jgi:type II secretory pathway pseudopilin PulG
MPLACKERMKMKMHNRSRSASGFALISALLAVSILAAMAVLVFTVTTQDVRISSRMVGEKKAFYGCEAGIHRLTQNLNPANLNDNTLYNVQFIVDPPTDPNTAYVISNPTIPTSGPPSLPEPGFSFDSGRKFVRITHVTNVAGTNTRYGSSVPITAGTGYGPVKDDTIHE